MTTHKLCIWNGVFSRKETTRDSQGQTSIDTFDTSDTFFGGFGGGFYL
jgi:hypothetical protein